MDGWTDGWTDDGGMGNQVPVIRLSSFWPAGETFPGTIVRSGAQHQEEKGRSEV